MLALDRRDRRPDYGWVGGYAPRVDARATDLHHAFVGAFGPYLKAIVEKRGYPEIPSGVLNSARAWLETELTALLETPYSEQRRSPLEVLQEAMRAPTDWLASQGVRPPLRDPVAVAALPGDTYNLAPASSAVLGEEAFHAHLAWGAAKAGALGPLVNRPAVVLVSTNLMDRSRFEETVGAAGLSLEIYRGTPGSSQAVMAFVDATHPECEAAVRHFVDVGVRVVAFGPHVAEDALARAAALGADATVTRSRLFSSLRAYLPRDA